MLMGTAYVISDFASPTREMTISFAESRRNSDDASTTAVVPEIAVPRIAATSGEDILKPTAIASKNASVVAIGSSSPREEMSCCITFIPRDTAVESQTWHGAKNQCERGNHLWLQMKPVIKKTKCYNYNNGRYHRLNDSKHHCDVKERPASCPVTDGF